MKYPITIEQLKQEYQKINGCAVSDSQQKLLIEIADLLNWAYLAGLSEALSRKSKTIA